MKSVPHPVPQGGQPTAPPPPQKPERVHELALLAFADALWDPAPSTMFWCRGPKARHRIQVRARTVRRRGRRLEEVGGA